MAKFGDLVQKAFYLGVGLASYAGEKAGETLVELRAQAQKLADELVAKGEITAEEAKRMVDDMVIQAQQTQAASSGDAPAEPRRIEILEDDDSSATDTRETPTTDTPPSQADALRSQVEDLQAELRRLRNDS
ncbi:MAG: phasin family protein [Cyanobacteria bacterium J06638_20]